MATVYGRWLKKRSLVDATVRIEQVHAKVTFHIPYDPYERLYLQFRCAKCGNCCRNMPYSGLLLTLGDMRRLSKFMGYSLKEFIEKECILAEVEEHEVSAYPGFPVKARYMGYYLKRFEDENEETVTKPGPCRFLNENNLCNIYPVRPTPCRKFPYMIFIKRPGEYDAYYMKMEMMGDLCKGFVERKKVKRKWLGRWVDILVESVKETIETVKSGLLVISEVEDVGKA